MAQPSYKRCIFMLADGARIDVFQDLLERGDLPNIARYILEPGRSMKSLVTCFPSITGPAYMPYLLGCYPSTCNVPGIRWFDRDAYHEKNFPWQHFRSYIGVESVMLDRDIAPDRRTVFDLIDRSAAIFSPIRRGMQARYDHTQIWKHWYHALMAHWTDNWQAVDNTASRHLLRLVDQDLQFIYAVFPGIDEYSHFDSPFGKRTLNAYRQLDRTVGKLVQALQQRGQLDSTLLAIGSDHGLSDTHSHFELWDFMNRRGYKTMHYPKIFNRDFNAASMVSGNAFGHLYLRQSADWKERTPYEAIADTLIPALVDRPEIGIVVSRSANGCIHVNSSRGHAEITVENDMVSYRVIGRDPFGYQSHPAYCSPNESLQATFDTTYPDAVVQAHQVFQSRRTGDVVISAALGYDLRSKYENPEHFASHGSLHADHMLVPFFLSHPLDADHFRTIDVFPTLLELLDVSWDVDRIDGVSRVTYAPALAAAGT